MAMIDLEGTGDDDIYSLFESQPSYNLQENESYRKLLVSAQGNSRPSTARNIPMRLGTSTGFRQGIPTRPGTSFRPITSFRPGSTMRLDTSFRTATGRPGTNSMNAVNRPMTAVRGAGYTSHGKKMFDPLNQASQMGSQSTDQNKEETPEEKIHNLENKIMQFIEESIVSSCENKLREGLDKAKEASSKERNLIRLQEQAGLSDSHNLDLTFAVLFNLANQYGVNEMYTEALNTYQLITKNRMFSNSHRLKVNMGNIYFRQGHFHKAVKMYRMALDQVPSTQNIFRIKIMHNIGMVFVRMGQYGDAVASLEYIMSEGRSTGFHLHKAGLHLILCHYALEDKEKMKHAFTMLLDVPLEVDEDDKYRITSDDPEEIIIADAIRNDELHKYEQSLRKEAEYCILTAAKLISPVIEENFSDGYEWCVQAIKNSSFAQLAGDLEINKAVMFLKQSHMTDAIDTLKIFEKESKIATSAATNLSFIYYLQGDFENSEKYAELVKTADVYNANGFVNLGVCALSKGDLNKAKSLFETALDCDPSHVEALFNLGLAYKRLGLYSEALACFQRFTGPMSLLPEVLYQMGSILELLGDSEAAADSYQQLLGVCPTDPGILQRLGQLYDHEGDKQQAYHYQYDSFRHYPSDLNTINWLGSYYIELQVVEKAQVYFEKASLMQPAVPKWRLLVAGCHRRAGNLHRALGLYQDIHQRFPDSVECLKLLVRLCTELGMREEVTEYTTELKRLERTKEVRDRVSSSRPGTASRRSASSVSSRSAISPVQELGRISSPVGPIRKVSGGLRNSASRLATLRDSMDSEESAFSQSIIDASYTDPLGPMAIRPRTSGFKNQDEDFGDETIGDDLLPE